MTDETQPTGRLVRVTEYLDVDLDRELWCCHVCGWALIDAAENYKRGCLVHERDPSEIYPPVYREGDYRLTVADGYGLFIEFYCPGCGTMVENELLPEGYPPSHDIQLDIEALKAKHKDEAGR